MITEADRTHLVREIQRLEFLIQNPRLDHWQRRELGYVIQAINRELQRLGGGKALRNARKKARRELLKANQPPTPPQIAELALTMGI